jgi:hypothetical protein
LVKLTLEQAGIPPTLSVGEVARRSGVSVSTLHFYEAKGLISSRRTQGNQRRYTRDVLRRVAFIGCGCLSIDRCRLRNPYDKLAAAGPGPQRLWVRRRAMA